MLSFNDAQWGQIQHSDDLAFVRAVHAQFLRGRPELRLDPLREETLARMRRAHTEGIALGFRSTPHLVQWLYLAADAPQIMTDASIRAQLLKPGASPEQRFDDLLATVRHLLRAGR